jgi:hypothetical protein
MLLFRGEEHIARWCTQWSQPRGATLTVEQAWGLARAWFWHKMDREWRRATIDEAENILAGLGLSGEFWSLR